MENMITSQASDKSCARPMENESIEENPLHIIADMYERWSLDFIVEVVQAVAIDFVNRPRQYRQVPLDVCEILQNFWFLTGTDSKFPNRMQRSMVFWASLGPSDGVDIMSSGSPSGSSSTSEGAQYKLASARLRETARAYTERQVTQGEAQLLQAFLDEALTLQSYLNTLRNDNNALHIGNTQTKSIFDNAVKVLQNEDVARVFGRPAAPTKTTWPLGVSLNDDGSRLIEEIARAFPSMLKPITQNQFGVMQRVAGYGAQTVSLVINGEVSSKPSESLEERKKRVEPLIGVAYSWKTALDSLR